ncbi:signal peptidase I [Microbacterium sp. A94]|uniref:signal peptidase I n=1 Tax=Microbacterium sp. A94 TaxID=3450717 RepID=UPI003F43FBC6
MARTRRIVGTIVLSAVCALAFFTVVIPFVLGAQSYTVLTGSMRPALDPGHLIAVRETPIDEIKVGDIVTFQIESGKPEVATHRVVGIGYGADSDRLLITQGDANNVQDANPVQEVQLRGVVVYAIPWLGYINIWATPAVKSTLVTVLGVGAIGWGLFMLVKDTRTRRRVARAGAAVTTAALLVIAFPFATTTPAQAATTSEYLLLSTDGITWTTGSNLALPDVAKRIVPGKQVPIELWVRNASSDAAEFTITGLWSPGDSTAPEDIALAADLIPPRLEGQALAPGDSVQAPVSVGLAASSNNSTRTASAVLTVSVTLTQSVGSPIDDPLATTGATIPTGLIISAAVLVGAGLLVLLIRLIAARRKNRRDP